MRRLLQLSGLIVWICWSIPAFAFTYLEHSYFADRGCRLAQEAISSQLQQDSLQASPDLVAAYLALAVMCPESWTVPYCARERKQVQAAVNRLKAPTAERWGYAITFGDFAALPDHVSRFGPIQNMPIPADHKAGLVSKTFAWIAQKPATAGGLIENVAEEACDTGSVPWDRVDLDIQAFRKHESAETKSRSMPGSFLSPIARSPLKRGPKDKAALYSFNNPHYLDLVLRDTDHFAEHAYSSWLGFHSAAVDIAYRSCPEVIALDPDLIEKIADGLPQFATVEWDDLEPATWRVRACEVLAARVQGRLGEWRQRADPALTAPVENVLTDLLNLNESPEAAVVLQKTVSAIMGLVFEGLGLHYLEDGMSSGHIRSVQDRRSLGERRWDHDLDCRNGVTAVMRTPAGERISVIFGDTYLLGPSYQQRETCDWQQLEVKGATREEVADCILQQQRGLLASTVAASVLDWSLQGLMFNKGPSDKTPCAIRSPAADLVCQYLPLQAPRIPGQEVAGISPRTHLVHGVLPIPPPTFHYQSLDVVVGVDAAGAQNQVGIDANFYTRLGRDATWLTRYHFGLRSTVGSDADSRFLADFAYGFHYRWGARFLVDMEPFIFAGIAGSRADRGFISGLGPRVGISGLPEGWIKLPLEISISYRLPIILYSSTTGSFGRGIEIEGHWIQLGLGLAFM